MRGVSDAERPAGPGPAARPVVAVDARRLARPFVRFLAAVAGVGILFVLLAASNVVGTLRLAAAYGVAAGALLVVLVVRIRRAARDHGDPVDPDDVLYDVPATDLAGLGIVAAGVGVALVVLLGAPGGPGAVEPTGVPFWLAVGGLLLGAAGLLRATRVRLVVTPDAVLRVPAGPGGLANRYPLDELRSVDAGRRVLRVRTGFPLADWSCLVARPDEVETLVADLREAPGAPGSDPVPTPEEG